MMPEHDETYGQPIASCTVCEAAAAKYEAALAAPQLVGPWITAMDAHDTTGKLLPPMVGGAPRSKR